MGLADLPLLLGLEAVGAGAGAGLLLGFLALGFFFFLTFYLRK